MSRRLTSRNYRPEKISRGSEHSGTINCIKFTRNSILCSGVRGFVITGSSDRTIKVLNPFSIKSSNIVQTLFGHESSVTNVADGNDGTLLSCALDGTLRIWAPQSNRSMMLNPFFECIISLKNNNPSAWYTAIIVNHTNIWTCYVGDTDGNSLCLSLSLSVSLSIYIYTYTV